MRVRLFCSALVALGLVACAAHVSADVFTVDSSIRENHAFGSGPDGSNPDQDHLNTATSPSLWLDSVTAIGAGVDGSAVPFSFNSSAGQVSDFSQSLGTFSVSLSSAATSSYTGAETPASSTGFSLFDQIFTITDSVTYSFTAANVGDAPFLFELLNLDTTNDELGGFATSGSGVLGPGQYLLGLAVLSSSTSDQNGSDGTKNSDLTFGLQLTPSPVPEPATILTLASICVTGLAYGLRRNRGSKP